MATLEQQLKKAFDEKVLKRAAAVQQKLALEAFRRVIQKSPVDTGRFRGNWQLSVGSPEQGTLETTSAPNQGAALGKLAAITPGNFTVVYLTNNLPYAEVLEDGSSAQAPHGVVGVTIAELRAELPRLVQAGGGITVTI